MKLSFHEGKFSMPWSFSMERRLPEEEVSEREEDDDDMLTTEGEKEGRGDERRR